MRPSHVLLAVLVTAVWGVNSTVIEVGLDHFPPLLFVAWVAAVSGFGARGRLLRRHPAPTVAPFSLLVPVFGMSSAALLLGESVRQRRPAAVPAVKPVRRAEARTEDSPVGG